MNLEQFGRLMHRRAKELPEAVNRVKVKVAETGLFSLVQSTPVDKGDAVSNWQVGLGSPVVNVIPAYHPGEGRDTMEQNQLAVLAASKKIFKAAKPGQTIHLTNAIHYIMDLEMGSSLQAPAGMTRGALVAMRFNLRNVKLFTE
ncbi:tail completion or Neck1 protein [Stenotrophomonas phage vB_SmaS_Bhz55]